MTKNGDIIELAPVELLRRHDPDLRLTRYFEILKAENQKINLVSRETIDSGLEILAAESLLPFDQIERQPFRNYLDIGSGGGLPAFPILLTKPIEKATLVERVSKKSLALGRIVRGLYMDSTSVEIVEGNFEELSFEGQFDLVTLRLVALTKRVLKKIDSVLASSGIFIYYAAASDLETPKSMSCVTYCYKTSVDAPTKSFTICRKIV
ncbi:MAG: RsmG family class I SAM-dependent methyltransferase [Candidatus Zixiibacteriota bacterium]